jgi:hypothetical protein
VQIGAATLNSPISTNSLRPPNDLRPASENAPPLIKQCISKGDGGWWSTHVNVIAVTIPTSATHESVFTCDCDECDFSRNLLTALWQLSIS